MLKAVRHHFHADSSSTVIHVLLPQFKSFRYPASHCGWALVSTSRWIRPSAATLFDRQTRNGVPSLFLGVSPGHERPSVGIILELLKKQCHCHRGHWFDGGIFLAPWLLSPQLDIYSHASVLQPPSSEGSTRAYASPCIKWPPRSVSLEGKLSISNGRRIGCLFIRASIARGRHRLGLL